MIFQFNMEDFYFDYKIKRKFGSQYPRKLLKSRKILKVYEIRSSIGLKCFIKIITHSQSISKMTRSVLILSNKAC